MINKTALNEPTTYTPEKAYVEINEILSQQARKTTTQVAAAKEKSNRILTTMKEYGATPEEMGLVAADIADCFKLYKLRKETGEYEHRAFALLTGENGNPLKAIEVLESSHYGMSWDADRRGDAVRIFVARAQMLKQQGHMEDSKRYLDHAAKVVKHGYNPETPEERTKRVFAPRPQAAPLSFDLRDVYI